MYWNNQRVNMHDEIMNSVYELLSHTSGRSMSQFIESNCKVLNISQRQLSDLLNIQRRSLQRIIEGEAQKLDIITLLKIAHFFGMDIKEVIGIYMTKVSNEDKKAVEQARISGYIIKKFDVKTLTNMGFFSSSKDFEAIEERICKFFNITSIFQYDNICAGVLFSQTRRGHSDKMLDFWISIVKTQVEQLKNPNLFDRDKLLKVIPRLRIFAADSQNGFHNFITSLYECGVTVVYESYITKTQIRGGTFYMNNAPAIVITNLNHRYDTMWFALAHELCHVLYDMDIIDSIGYHLTGENDLFTREAISEERANNFARRLLLGDDKLDLITNFIDSEALVKTYAKKWGTHPSIIYGQYLWGKPKNEYMKFRNKILNADIITQRMEIEPWKHETIAQTVRLIKQNVLRLRK